MWRIGSFDISNIAVVDDQEDSRDSLRWILADAQLTMQEITGPLGGIDAVYQEVEQTSDALISDHHLSATDYARFEGAELVAKSTESGFPAILCTRYVGPDIDSIRPLLPWIPVIRTPDELNEPEEVMSALEECEAELAGRVRPERKPWRTQLVVERVDGERGTFEVSAPAWEIEETIRIRVGDIPEPLRPRIAIGFRMFAMTNLESQSAARFFATRWET